jgi:hypothetical protein
MATEMLWVSLGGRQGQIPHANGSTHSCVTKSSGISAEPCMYNLSNTHRFVFLKDFYYPLL